MREWVLQKLADRLGVAPPEAGEAINPHLRFEQPWPQWLLVFTVLGSVSLIVWLYRHEGKAKAASKLALAALRICVVLLAVFMLSEAVLSVERTGLPYVTILIDDSASQRIADQYENPAVQTALDAPAAGATTAAVSSEPPTRLAIAKGLILRDKAKLLRELEKQHKVRLYRVSNAAQVLTEVDRPADLERAVRLVRDLEASGDQSRLGDGLRHVLTELRGAPPSAIVLFTDGQTTEGEPLVKASEMAVARACRCSRSDWGAPSRPATSS